MPELPEVETVRRGLLPAMDGQKITLAEVRRPDLRWPFPPRMADRLTGATVTRLGRRSKYLLVDLSSGETLLWHLGMSGRVLIEGDLQGRFHHGNTGSNTESNTGSNTHDHVVFHMANGSVVTFNDARRFGAMDLAETAQVEAHPWLAKLGPEPLGNTFSEGTLIEGFAGKKTSIKAALLDQRIVAGLGNIYVCEALFRAGISPKRQAGRISAARLAALVPTIRQVLSEAIEAGGSSLQDHRQPSGELGYFQHFFKVYDREDEPCVTPGCDARIRRIVQSGRSSFYCGQCQR